MAIWLWALLWGEDVRPETVVIASDSCTVITSLKPSIPEVENIYCMR